MTVEEDSLLDTSLFQEPEGYYQKPKGFTFQNVKRALIDQEITLRLVGHHSLWVRSRTFFDKRRTAYGTLVYGSQNISTRILIL
jgi:hypothetical protein